MPSKSEQKRIAVQSRAVKGAPMLSLPWWRSRYFAAAEAAYLAQARGKANARVFLEELTAAQREIAVANRAHLRSIDDLIAERDSARAQLRESVRLCNNVAMALGCPDSWEAALAAIYTLQSDGAAALSRAEKAERERDEALTKLGESMVNQNAVNLARERANTLLSAIREWSEAHNSEDYSIDSPAATFQKAAERIKAAGRALHALAKGEQPAPCSPCPHGYEGDECDADHCPTREVGR